ncbi:MAG: N-acetylmuramic acid 6-phosphate etherase [Streptosporangiaceae bacterium]|jgi:N-acetylmuramic acid 6-phosphate etherase
MTASPDAAGSRADTDQLPAVTAPTEQRNPSTTDIDLLPTVAVLELLHAEDERVPAAVRPALGPLAVVVDEAAERIRRGGRVHYFGAGSSGRIAVLDAAELMPTFGLAPGVVIAHLAGGEQAIQRAVEDAEDDEARGAQEAAASVTGADLVLGLSASGSTPYVAGALATASGLGAFTAVATCNPDSRLLALAQVPIVADTGPEAIAGSTRLKATSAFKLILNGFSTALMIRLGKTYSNLMVEVAATNSKLRTRKVRILVDATGADEATCGAALARADGELRPALVALLGGVDVPTARRAIEESGGVVRDALTRLNALLRLRKEMPRSDGLSVRSLHGQGAAGK